MEKVRGSLVDLWLWKRFFEALLLSVVPLALEKRLTEAESSCAATKRVAIST